LVEQTATGFGVKFGSAACRRLHYKEGQSQRDV
jgi:hypothetical protein